MKTRFGTFFSIHAAESIARVTPVASERGEMLKWLESQLDHEKKHVRWMCADGLGRFGDDSLFAINSLRRSLNDECPTVRILAARAIWRISKDDSLILEAVSRVLRDKDVPYYCMPVSLLNCPSLTHVLAMQTLGEIQTEDQRAVELLCDQLSSGDFVHRSIAVSTLLQLPIRRSCSREAMQRITEMAHSDESTKLRGEADLLLAKLHLLKD